MLIERAAFERLGGFDSAFFMFYEDIDLCLRANAAGYSTVIEPHWAVRHARHHSTEECFGQAMMWSYESAVRFHAKHGSPVRAYRAYAAADSALRVAWHFRRNRTRASEYAGLAKRAARDAMSKVQRAPGWKETTADG
jgi:GT2 family glycosyltransferase